MGLRNLRRAVQLLSLAGWGALFLLTRKQVGGVPADLFLITDPLVALLTLGASRVFVPILLVSLVLVALTLVFGRAFCGWLCPLGTLLDGVGKVLRPPEDRISFEAHTRMQRWKYYLLAAMAVAALLSSQWAFLLDPLVLLFRAFASAVWPAVTAVVPPSVLPEALREERHEISLLPFALLLAALSLTALSRRFWCRYLCPLGAFYGLLSRVPLLRRRVKGCDVCTGLGPGAPKACTTGCRMGAVHPKKPGRTQNHECIRCFAGRSACHKTAIHFDWKRPVLERSDDALALGRREVLAMGAVALGTAPLVSLATYHRGDPNGVVRPPAVIDEDTFLDQCVRCGMCVQSCPTQTLQLLHLEAGLSGLWTPALTPRLGGCIAGCNACAVVCPTDAIPLFGKRNHEKWAVKMGTAVLEKNRCLPYTDNVGCNKCVEVCPTKAFLVDPEDATHPARPASIDYAKCVGCGLCEEACRKVVFGTPALLTFSRGRGEPTSLAPEAPEER